MGWNKIKRTEKREISTLGTRDGREDTVAHDQGGVAEREVKKESAKDV